MMGGGAVTNARFASFRGLPVGPFSLSTTPVPLRKPRARHEWHLPIRRKGGFRLRLGGGVTLRLRFARRSSPFCAPLSPLADRRPKPRFITILMLEPMRLTSATMLNSHQIVLDREDQLLSPAEGDKVSLRLNSQ